MTTATATLAEWLLARISDDEAVAQAVERESERLGFPRVGNDVDPRLSVEGVGDMDWPVLTIDPARVLADCAARRAIVEEVSAWEDRVRQYDGRQSDIDFGKATAGTWVLRHLAAPYASSPDFDPAWAVS